MPRASIKTDLAAAANGQFHKLWVLIDSMAEEQQKTPFDFGEDFNKKEAHWARDKNLRDVLTHLYEWHQLLLNWVEKNQGGTPAPFLPKPYNWKTYGQMNVGFWEKHQATTYGQAEKMLKESHAEVMAMIEPFSDEALFEKNYFNWTGTSPLGSYCVSATASHYDWAMKKIKAHLNACRKGTL